MSNYQKVLVMALQVIMSTHCIVIFVILHFSFQTLTMFLGEFVCLLVFFLQNMFQKIKQYRAAKKAKQQEVVSSVSMPTADDLETEAFLQNQAKSYGSSATSPEKMVPSTASEKKQQQQQPPNPLIFILPSICDLLATTCQNIGLIFTSVSVFQSTSEYSR